MIGFLVRYQKLIKEILFLYNYFDWLQLEMNFVLTENKYLYTGGPELLEKVNSNQIIPRVLESMKSTISFISWVCGYSLLIFFRASPLFNFDLK
ncbi:MAG: hypothetical protein Ct9H90mP7_2600 [Candidatus Neomarinimicrobiota bacterium]|nr:MAG: hypothetical protein Ct9H90mP7_2600 [Candidatus Neomarinimicrobiota bacterium]